ncbi:hypothetical protein FBU30_004797, partial [Linnemannia zychae]
MNIYDQSAFSDFMTSVTQSEQASLEVSGSVQGSAITSLGNIQLKVPLMAVLPLKGINFSNSKPIISDILVIRGDTKLITLTANVGLDNPSIFGVNMGRIVLQIGSTINGTYGYVSAATIPTLILNPGMNIIQASIVIMPETVPFADSFLSSYLAGDPIQSFIYGDAQTSAISSMVPTLQTLKMATVIPGMTPKPRLIAAATGTPSLGTLLGPRQVPLTVSAFNPLATNFWIDTITAEVWWEGSYFGGIDKAYVPFEVPVNQTVLSPVVILQSPTDYQFALFLITQFIPKDLGILTGANVDVDMTSRIFASIGGAMGMGYHTTITYEQKNIQALLKIDYSFAGLTKRFLDAESSTSSSLLLSSSPTSPISILASGAVEIKALSPIQR